MKDKTKECTCKCGGNHNCKGDCDCNELNKKKLTGTKDGHVGIKITEG